jgi:chromosomal replication initiator protein
MIQKIENIVCEMIVPRFKRSPIDTSIYNWYTIKKRVSVSFVDKIREIVKNVTGIDPYIENKYSGMEFVMSRQLFMYFIRKYTKLSLRKTGQLVGKDHATVIHAEKCVNKFIDTEKSYQALYNEIETKIKKIKL